MASRRTFLSFLAGTAVAPHLAFGQGRSPGLALYANVGPVLTHYDADLVNAELIQRDSVRLPAAVQYAWPHRDRRHFYVASSDNVPGNVQTGAEHHVTAFRIDPITGALSQLGDSMRLPARPIHLTLDNESQHILVAFNNPSSLRVYRVNKDFTPGREVQQGAMDAGIYAHQVRVTPDGRHVVLVTRGNEGTSERPEDPGALMVFDYKNGMLSNEYKIAPNGGRGYGPRHLDFHPTKPWMYVSIETQNKLYMYRIEKDGINPEIAYRSETLAEPNNIRARQAAGTVHVHPNGRFVYGANRAEATTEFQGKQVFKGGENSIVVYAIDQSIGEPIPIQHIETQKIHPRTFHIDPSGRLLVAQHNLPVNVRDGDVVRIIPAGLSVFRIGDDGKLTFARKYDIDVGDKTMFWMGMVPL